MLGTGILCCASVLVGAQHILAIDADPLALHQAQQNIERLDDVTNTTVDFIQAKVKYIPSSNISNKNKHQRGRSNKRLNHELKKTTKIAYKEDDISNDIDDEDYDDGIPLKSKCVDTVLINPPFGTKGNPGIDIGFLRVGCRLARNVVYSFHKTSTRSFILQKVRRQWNMQCDVVAQMKFDIPATYKFHKVDGAVDVAVDLLKIIVRPTPSSTLMSIPISSSSILKHENDQYDSNDDSTLKKKGM